MVKKLPCILCIMLITAIAAVAAHAAFLSFDFLEQRLGDNASYTDEEKEIIAERIFHSSCLISGTVAERPLIDSETGISVITLRISEKRIAGKYALVGFLPIEQKRISKLKIRQKITVMGYLVQYNGFPNPVYGRSEVGKYYLALIDAVMD